MVKGVLPGQGLSLASGEDRELLVGGGVEEHLHAAGAEGVLDPLGQIHRLAPQLKVEAVLEQNLELDAQYPALGQHAPHAFDHITEVPLNGQVGDDHGLPKKGPHLGAADVEYVGQLSQVRECDVVLRSGQTIAAPGSVDIQGDVPLPADLVDGLQLRLGVQRAQLRGLGEVDQTGLNGVLVAGIGPVY